ncbi:MAG: SAM-dependent methyltransferase [Chloroflexi bacterium]|nr:SAM-dependent methyltransferase [Chloroflexota bacterium]
MAHPPLEDALAHRIAAQGKITFAEFMALALYWPNGGYYSRDAAPGRARDYFTAPMTHPAFGALLALQLEEMWALLDRPDPFVVVEPGAGAGQLARDILGYARYLNASFLRSLRYLVVERAPASFRSATSESAAQGIIATGLPLRNLTGCILSNELLDALPVHRVVLRNGQLREAYITFDDDRFQEVEDKPSTPRLETRLEEEDVRLEEGQRAEVCLEMEEWTQQVASGLHRGFVLTMDYGHEAPDLYSAARRQGTLRCYFRHTLSANPYVRVGEQDITAHVDFTAVAVQGARRGLLSLPLQTQASFLNNLGLQLYQRRLAGAGLGQRERDANRMAMLELARPGGMGEFKVLVQTKNVAAEAITGVHGALEQWKARLAQLPQPLLDEDHLSLMEARYPHAAQAWEQWPQGGA